MIKLNPIEPYRQNTAMVLEQEIEECFELIATTQHRIEKDKELQFRLIERLDELVKRSDRWKRIHQKEKKLKNSPSSLQSK